MAKQRALEMTAAMNATEDVLSELIALIDDPDLSVRIDAIAVLGLSTSSRALSALRSAEHDAQRAVRDAAKESIERLCKNRDVAQPGDAMIGNAH
jgi:HEAT repeat protein